MDIKEQKRLLEIHNKRKEQNRKRQERFREKQKQQIEEGILDIEEVRKAKREEMKKYRERFNKKIEQIPPTPIPKIEDINKQRDKTKSKRKIKKDKHQEVIPSHQTRKEGLEKSTINDYILKINIIHKLLTDKALTPKLKAEITKLLNDNDFNEEYIKSNMTYITDDIDKTINIIRDKYKSDNSFKAYLTSLTVVLSYIPSLNENYQKITKIAKYINDEVQNKRKDNILPKQLEEKIIDLEKTVVLENLNKLKTKEGRLIYGLYTLFPSRRSDDYRLMRLVYYDNVENLDDEYNYLQITKRNDMNFIFNQYKTRKIYKQQIFEVPKDLQEIIIDYIDDNNLKEMDYLFYANKNKREKVAQSQFSTKVSNTFKKIYGIPISIDYIRKSHATYLNKMSNKMSTKSIEDYTNKMAHSTNENRLYRVIGYE